MDIKSINEIIQHLTWQLNNWVYQGHERKIILQCIKILCEAIKQEDD